MYYAIDCAQVVPAILIDTTESMVTEVVRCLVERGRESFAGISAVAVAKRQSWDRGLLAPPPLSRSPYVSMTTSPFRRKSTRPRLEDGVSTVTDGYGASGSTRPSYYPFCQSSSVAEQALAQTANADTGRTMTVSMLL